MLLPALRYGLKEFLSAIHAGRVVIGISGGIDSAVNAALYRSVLPAENLLLVNTPTRFNSETTKIWRGGLPKIWKLLLWNSLSILLSMKQFLKLTICNSFSVRHENTAPHRFYERKYTSP